MLRTAEAVPTGRQGKPEERDFKIDICTRRSLWSWDKCPGRQCKGPGVGRILTRSQDRNRRSEGEGGRGEGKGVDRGQSREGLEDWVKQRVAYSKLPLSHFPWSPHWSE